MRTPSRFERVGLRTRLAVLSAVVTLLVTLPLALLALQVTGAGLRRELDRSLVSATANVVEQYNISGPSIETGEFIPFAGLDDDDVSVLDPIVNPDGSASHDDLIYKDGMLLSDAQLIDEQYNPDEPTTIVGSRRWRVNAEEFTDRKGTVWLLAIGRDLATIDRQLHTLRRNLLLGAVIASALIGAFVAITVRIALRAVERIRHHAAAIGPASLHERLPQPATTDELGRLTNTLNEMLGRIEASTTMQRQFVADASHELRNPVAAMITQLEVAQQHPNHTDWDTLTTSLLRDGRRTQRLVNDLLLLARADEGQLRARTELVDLDDIAYEAAATVPSNGIAVDSTGVTAATIWADRDHVTQIATNLIANALRHARTKVAVSVTIHNGQAVLAVADDGPGIPSNERERVFDRFHRLDNARTRDSGGAGLGLAISRTLAHHNTATLTLSDSPLGGARFELRAPIANHQP